EVESQHGKAKAVQHLHGVEDDLVVQRSAKQRVRMANHRGMSCVLSARIEQRFQATGGAVEKERADGEARCNHISRLPKLRRGLKSEVRGPKSEVRSPRSEV